MESFDWKQFRKAYLAARETYLPQEGVLGVGYERLDKQLAIVVLATNRLATDRKLHGQLFPGTFDGFLIDMRVPDIDPEKDSDLHIIEWGKVHRMHQKVLANPSPQQPAPVRTAIVGQVFVIEDNGTLVTTINGTPTIDFVQAYQYFQQECGDFYDFVNMVPDTDSGMPSVSFDIAVFNDVMGINHYMGDPNNNDRYDDRATYGTNRLQDIQVLDPPHVALRQHRLHEIDHRWEAYVLFRTSSEPWDHYDLLMGDMQHWAEQFNNDFSPMDYDRAYWMDNHDGSFSEQWVVNDGDFAYCPLDLYLMGMYAPSEVDDLSSWFSRGFYYLEGLTRTPSDPTRVTGTRKDLTVADIAREHGWRDPTAADSPRSFRQAFVVLTKQLISPHPGMSPLIGKDLAAAVDGYRIAHTTEFRSATRSRGMLDTYLYTDPYDGIYIRDNASDTGTEPTSGTFWDSPDIWVRNADDGGTTHQDTIRGQDNYIYVRVRNNGSQPLGEITVNIFRANYAGTEFLYPEDWRLEDRVGSQIIASMPAGGEFPATFKWDKSMIPPAEGWHPCLLVEVLPIHRDKTKLRHVWEDRRLAQKNITIVDPPSGAQPLSFHFSIGARSLPARWVRIRVEQKEGDPVVGVALDLGRVDDWLSRLNRASFLEGRRIDSRTARLASLTDLLSGGEVIEREGLLYFVISNPFSGGHIALPLLEAERKQISLRLPWAGNPHTSKARFEITQLNDQNKIVGGLALVIRPSGFLARIVREIRRRFWM